MASKYTEEQRNSLDRETLIRLFLSQQEQLENIDHTLQLVLEQMADLKRHRFGRSSEKHETEDQISFMEVDGKIVFFNEAEAVAAEENTQEEPESVSRRKRRKRLRESAVRRLEKRLMENGYDSLEKFSADRRHADRWLGPKRIEELEKLRQLKEKEKKEQPVQLSLFDLEVS